MVNLHNGPAPEPILTRGRKSVYPYATMKLGDWFVVPAEKRKSAISSALNYRKRNPDFKITTYVSDAGIIVKRID